MSMQWDLRSPELGYFDEGADLTDAATYRAVTLPFGQATAMPAVAYRSKTFVELENENIWTRSWVAIGLLQQIPNPGDLLPFTIGFHGVHVQRNKDGTISARMNRHQHGGCRFVPEQCRTGAQTKCSIASCNYTRDSDVMPATESGENTDLMYKFVGLVPEKLTPVKCDTWGSIIFVNLDPDCRPLGECFDLHNGESLAKFIAPLKLEFRQWVDFACNWKAAGSAFVDLGLRPPEDSASAISVEAMMGWGSKGDDGTPSVLGVMARGDEGCRLAWILPNTLIVFHADGVVVILLQANGASKSLCRVFALSSQFAPKEVDAAPFFASDLATLIAAARAHAENLHKDFAERGTSLRPDTTVDESPIERNYASYLLNGFLASKLTQKHHYHWSAPIMDAALTMRR